MNQPHLLAAILAFLRTLAVPAIDAHEVGRDARLNVFAVSINAAAEHATCTGEFAVSACKPIASDPVRVASELITKADAETNLKSNVHRDEPKPHESDPVKVRVKGGVIVMHLARGPWQLHRASSWTAERWESYKGDSLEATTAAAWEAAKQLAGYRGMCKNGTEGAMAGFARGGKCTWSGAKKRARRAEQIRRRLVALMGKEVC
jgi:molybdenum cofactor biosynthesis enzyme